MIDNIANYLYVLDDSEEFKVSERKENIMRQVIDGCPYCGSIDGFEVYQVVHYALVFDQFGEPDGATEEIVDHSWKYPRCRSCGKRVLLKPEG